MQTHIPSILFPYPTAEADHASGGKPLYSLVHTTPSVIPRNYPPWVCVCVYYLLSSVQLFVTPSTDASPPDSSVHGIFQGRIREWVAVPFSRGSRPRDETRVSRIAGRFFTISVTREVTRDKGPPENVVPSPILQGFRASLGLPAVFRSPYNRLRQHIKKQRHYFVNKGPSSQGYGFSRSLVWM